MADGLFKAQLRRLMPKAVRPHRILSGPLRGLRIVTSWHDYPAAILGRTERRLLDWFEQHVKPGETWLDVGAHYGYTAIALSRLVGSHGRVFAFEPMGATSAHLTRTRTINELSQLVVVPCGLGAPESLRLTQLPVVRGMLDATVSEGCTTYESCLVARLDWLWDRICGGQRRIDGIKVDVQGMETDVLQGMVGLLSEFTPWLVIEVHQGVGRRELLELLDSVGYVEGGVPVEPASGKEEPAYLDDRSYSFKASLRNRSTHS
jgi:FkbM family methyltransferase